MSRERTISCQRSKYKGWKIREARLKAAIATQKELAELTGIHQTIISDLERGTRSLNPAWAMRIAEACGRKYQELLTEDDC